MGNKTSCHQNYIYDKNKNKIYNPEPVMLADFVEMAEQHFEFDKNAFCKITDIFAAYWEYLVGVRKYSRLDIYMIQNTVVDGLQCLRDKGHIISQKGFAIEDNEYDFVYVSGIRVKTMP